MNNKNYNNILVDVTSDENLDKDGFKRFTEDHLKTSKKLINKEAYPEYFGNEIISGLKIDDLDNCIRLIDKSLIIGRDVGGSQHNHSQSSRRHGKNPKIKEIKADITLYGYKLRSVPIMVIDNLDGTYTVINGRTREEILEEQGFENFICIVYTPENANDQLATNDAMSKMGLKSNAENDPAGDLMIEDVYKEGKDAIELGYMKLTGDTDNQVKTIRSRVDEVCGNGVLTDLKRSMVTYRILNRFIKYGKVISFTMPGSAKEWVRNSKFKDIEPTYDAFGTLTKRGLKYVVAATSTLHKSLMKAVIVAHENKDYDIRVLVHTGTLTGFDAEQTYAHKLWKFRKEWIQMLTELSFAFFNKSNYSSTPILLYGALPSVQDMGDLKSLKKFVSYSEASFEDIIKNGDFNDGLQDIKQ